MELSDDEVWVIEALDQNNPTLTFEEIKEATGISINRLEEILSRFIELGVISETKSKGFLHLEDEKKVAVIHVFEKNPD